MESTNCSYNAFRLTVKRKRLDMNMGYCCKIFSTYLRMNGVESDLLSTRCKVGYQKPYSLGTISGLTLIRVG